MYIAFDNGKVEILNDRLLKIEFFNDSDSTSTFLYRTLLQVKPEVYHGTSRVVLTFTSTTGDSEKIVLNISVKDEVDDNVDRLKQCVKHFIERGFYKV